MSEAFLCSRCRHNEPGGVRCAWFDAVKSEARAQCGGARFEPLTPRMEGKP